MSKLLPLLVLLGLAAAPRTAAQVPFSSTPGLYTTVSELDVIRGSDGERAVEVGVGWRFRSGVDLGLRVGGADDRFDALTPSQGDGRARSTSFGVEAAYTRWLSGRVGLRLEVAGRLERDLLDNALPRQGGSSGSYAVNRGAPEASVTAFRRVPVRGSVSAQPTVGVYVAGFSQTVTERDRGFSLRADAGQTYTDGQVGLELGLPILFRALGTDAALDLRTRLFDDFRQGNPLVSARLHLNF